jgi:hypothetical protein
MVAATGVRIPGGVDFRNNLFLSRRRRGPPHSFDRADGLQRLPVAQTGS